MSGMDLNQWRQMMGQHPYHFYQLANALVPTTSECNGIVYEAAYMGADRAGRREIRQAIEQAEQELHQHTRIWPTPRFCEATLAYPRLGDTRLTRTHDVGSDGRWLSLVLPDGELRALGPETESGGVTANLVYSDLDGDGLFETATATAVVPLGTVASEVVCRFLSADCGPVMPVPEITPRSVTISGVTATIVFDAWTLVRPVRTSSPIQQALDPGNGAAPAAAIAAQQVQVARLRADPTGTATDTAAAVLIWETAPWPWWAWCCDPVGGSDRDPAAVAMAVARAVIRDSSAGVIAIGEATYNTATAQWESVCDWTRCRPPDRVFIRYQAGMPRDGTQMQAAWAVPVARLAAAELARPICACTSANKELAEWQTDLSRTGVGQMDLFAAPSDFNNPFGSRRGQVYAWRFVQEIQRVIGVYAG